MSTTIPVILIVLSSLYAALCLVIAIMNFCCKSQALPSTTTRAAITTIVTATSLYLYNLGVEMTERELLNLQTLVALSKCSGDSSKFSSEEMVSIHETGASFAHFGFYLTAGLLAYTVLVEGLFLFIWNRSDKISTRLEAYGP
jgi:hypothetical protein